jgi:hypothetical protein
LRSSLIGAALALIPAGAQAEHCHSEGPVEGARKSSFAVHSEFARYRQIDFEGQYEGLFLGARRDFDWVLLGATLPLYSLSRNGRNVGGLGDLALEVSVPLRFGPSRPRDLGFGLISTLPTGDGTQGLGMGHVMFMPHVWYRLSRKRFELRVSIGAGLAWMNGSGAHHHRPQPVVNPMNSEEITFLAQPSYLVTKHLRAQTRFFGALPAVEGGAPRVLVGAGLEARTEAFFSSVELSLPMLGDPYQAKLSLGLGVLF